MPDRLVRAAQISARHCLQDIDCSARMFPVQKAYSSYLQSLGHTGVDEDTDMRACRDGVICNAHRRPRRLQTGTELWLAPDGAGSEGCLIMNAADLAGEPLDQLPLSCLPAVGCSCIRASRPSRPGTQHNVHIR